MCLSSRRPGRPGTSHVANLDSLHGIFVPGRAGPIENEGFGGVHVWLGKELVMWHSDDSTSIHPSMASDYDTP
jgi:hypothetical protein